MMLVNADQCDLAVWRIHITCFLSVHFGTMEDAANYQTTVIFYLWREAKQYV